MAEDFINKVLSSSLAARVIKPGLKEVGDGFRENAAPRESLTSKHECQLPALREKTNLGRELSSQQNSCCSLCRFGATIQAHRPGSESTNHYLPQVWLSFFSSPVSVGVEW